MTRYLTAKQVAERLACSLSRAYEVMVEAGPLRRVNASSKRGGSSCARHHALSLASESTMRRPLHAGGLPRIRPVPPRPLRAAQPLSTRPPLRHTQPRRKRTAEEGN